MGQINWIHFKCKIFDNLDLYYKLKHAMEYISKPTSEETGLPYKGIANASDYN
jgi:hypothetical protein